MGRSCWRSAGSRRRNSSTASTVTSPPLRTALAALKCEATKPLLLGVTGFAGQLPTFLLAPFAGVIVDRTDRYRLLLVTQVPSMLQSGLLAYYALRGTITVWHVLFLAIL